ncbi:MAG: VCBS repeat-containing protein, partial [Myxococcota bacterium]
NASSLPSNVRSTNATDAFALQSDEVRFYVNSGSGFLPITPMPNPFAGLSMRRSFVADFTGDGVTDLLVEDKRGGEAGYIVSPDLLFMVPEVISLRDFELEALPTVGDITGDALLDVYTEETRASQLYFSTSDRQAVSFPVNEVFLGEVGSTFLDRFGRVVDTPPVSIAPYSTEHFGTPRDLLRIARDQGIALPPNVIPLGPPIRFAGDVNLVRGFDGRLRPTVREDLPGSDLIPTEELSAVSSLTIDVEPVRGFAIPLTLLQSAPGSLRVIQWVQDWVRDESDPTVLPTRNGEPVIIPFYRAREVLPDDDDDLSTGSGPRYISEDEDFLIATERLGIFQVFVTP